MMTSHNRLRAAIKSIEGNWPSWRARHDGAIMSIDVGSLRMIVAAAESTLPKRIKVWEVQAEGGLLSGERFNRIIDATSSAQINLENGAATVTIRATEVDA